jgi:hypothetical protein
MGKYPLQVSWLTRVVNYWNKRVAQVTLEEQRLAQSASSSAQQNNPNQAGSLLTQVFCANVYHGLVKNMDCWSKELCTGLQFVMPSVDWRSQMQGLLPIDVRQVMQHAKQAFCTTIQQFQAAPTLDSTKERQRCKYAQWMLLGGITAPHTELPVPAYLIADTPLIKKRALARARLSCAPIRTNQVHAPSYSLRHCERCRCGMADTEAHWLFQCARLENVRQKHATLLDKFETLPALMAAVYDSRYVGEVMDYVLEATEVADRIEMEGHRQGSAR